MIISNIKNRNGNKAVNQFQIDFKDFTAFQSYETLILIKNNETNEVILDSGYRNYSTTTSKYRNIFLNETSKETEKKIKQGIYKLSSNLMEIAYNKGLCGIPSGKNVLMTDIGIDGNKI